MTTKVRKKCGLVKFQYYSFKHSERKKLRHFDAELIATHKQIHEKLRYQYPEAFK
jgi:hypothetical protein